MQTIFQADSSVFNAASCVQSSRFVHTYAAVLSFLLLNYDSICILSTVAVDLFVGAAPAPPHRRREHARPTEWMTQVLGSVLRGLRHSGDVEVQERCGLAREGGGPTVDSEGVDHQLGRGRRRVQGVPLRMSAHATGVVVVVWIAAG